MEHLTISLSPEIARSVEHSVAAGDYASREAAVGAALREWVERREGLGYSHDELKAMVQEGLSSGFVPHVSMDEIKAEARRRLKASQEPG